MEKGWVINRVNNEGDSLGAFHLRIAAFDAGCANAAAGQAVNREKGWVINRVNNEGDSLGAFHLRIAAFDAGCANAAAGQDADGGYSGRGGDVYGIAIAGVWLSIRKKLVQGKRLVRRGFLSQSLSIPLIVQDYRPRYPLG